jgi:radical SAM protein with 4Fe4S-binding SPASM domain
MTSRPRIASLIFEVTQRCNHACLHCYNVWQGPQPAGRPYPRGEFDTARTLSLLAKALDECDCPHVTLTGGEPLLRPDLERILDFLQERKVRVTLISNGRLLDDRRVAALVGRGAALFELPLLSHRREMHDELSAAPGAWDAVLKAMTAVRLARGQVVAAFVLTRRNAADLAEALRLAFAFGARGVMINRFNPGGRGRDHLEELLPSVAQVREALATAESASAEYRLPISCSIPIQPCLIDTAAYPHIGFGYCAAGSERAYYALDPLGNLRPCNHSDLILGNLFANSFAELISPEKLSAFTCALPAHCSACERRLECQGGCKAAAQVCSGSLSAEEPFLRQALPAA